MKRKQDNLDILSNDEIIIRCEQLERDRKYLFERATAFETNWEQEKTSAIAYKQQTDAKLHAALKNIQQLSLELSELKSSSCADISRLEHELELKQLNLDSLQLQNKHLEESCNQSFESLKLKNLEIQNLNKELSTLISPSAKKLSIDTNPAMFEQMKENLALVKKLESKIASLSQENSSYKSLNLTISKKEEEIHSLNHQLSQLSNVRKLLAECQVEKSVLMQERAKWEMFCEPGESDPTLISRALSNERLVNAQLQEEIGIYKSEKSGREKYISRLESQIIKFNNDISLMKNKNEEIKSLLNNANRAKQLSDRESSFFKEQLKSYEMEASITGEKIDSHNIARIAELETILNQYKSAVTESKSTESNKYVHSEPISDVFSPSISVKIKEYQDIISQLKIENGMLQRQVKSAESQIQDLNSNIDYKNDKSENTRILMLKDNPESIAKNQRIDELRYLRAENEALRGSSISVPTESINVFKQKIQELTNEVNNKDKRMMRLKEVLGTQVKEFREAIYSILGYKVDMQPNGRIKLSCIYAPSRIFEFETSGTLIMGGEISDLQEGISKYLEREHVAAFMGWTTLHFFNSPE